MCKNERKIRAAGVAALCLASAAFAAGEPAASESALTAGQVVARMDDSLTFGECVMTVEFEDRKASGSSRTLEAEVYYAKDSGTMLEFVSPEREKGKRILMIGDSAWMAAPGVSRPVRLAGNDAFMGTSFTNDDVMNMEKGDDYDAAFVAETADAWTVELKARRRSLSYQRIVVEIGKDFLPRRQSMYLLSGALSKTIEFGPPRAYGAKLRPSSMTVRDAMTSGNETIVRFKRIVETKVDRAKLSPATFAK